MMGPVRAVSRSTPILHKKTRIMVKKELDIKQELQLTVMNLYNFNMERIKDFKLCDLMSYVESKDKECHHKFKLRFRKEGWII